MRKYLSQGCHRFLFLFSLGRRASFFFSFQISESIRKWVGVVPAESHRHQSKWSNQLSVASFVTKSSQKSQSAKSRCQKQQSQSYSQALVKSVQVNVCRVIGKREPRIRHPESCFVVSSQSQFRWSRYVGQQQQNKVLKYRCVSKSTNSRLFRQVLVEKGRKVVGTCIVIVSRISPFATMVKEKLGSQVNVIVRHFFFCLLEPIRKKKQQQREKMSVESERKLAMRISCRFGKSHFVTPTPKKKDF